MYVYIYIHTYIGAGDDSHAPACAATMRRQQQLPLARPGHNRDAEYQRVPVTRTACRDAHPIATMSSRFSRTKNARIAREMRARYTCRMSHCLVHVACCPLHVAWCTFVRCMTSVAFLHVACCERLCTHCPPYPACYALYVVCRALPVACCMHLPDVA